MDVVSYAKAKAVDDRLTQALAAGNNPSGWMADRDAINAKLSDASKISQTLINGTSVINATLDAPATVEVQGRTLVSMGSSVLQNGKQFVLTDKKTKIRTLGSKSAQIQGVAKFVQTVPSSDTANFVGKVSGSTVENPHIAKSNIGLGQTALLIPSAFPNEFVGAYTSVNSLNGTGVSISNSANGSISQTLFSFDLIQEIERNIGRIPGITTADKVSWIKANVTQITFNWYGYGSGPAGNKATTVIWETDLNSGAGGWQAVGSGSGITSHSSGTITKLSPTSTSVNVRVDTTGFVHMLAYADASDGITASTITTDYVELVITLNSSLLDTRPVFTRIANFDGKVVGSTVEAPHTAKSTNGIAAAALIAPSVFVTEATATQYTNVQTQDGTLFTTQNSNNGAMAEQLFQFDVVQEIERNLGRIPKATLADKAQWVRDNLASFYCNWWGYGFGPNGYKANLPFWYPSNSTWVYAMTNTANSPSLLSQGVNNGSQGQYIDSNGFMYFMAYADPTAPIADPTTSPVLSATGTGGTLPTGTYYVRYSWMNSSGETKVSPESSVSITLGQKLQAVVPTYPAGATGVYVYISQTSGDVNAFKGGLANNATTYLASTPLAAPSVVNTTNTALVWSTINTDRVELAIELKPQAVLHDPVVPLYQIDDTTEYTNILTTWLEAEVLTRYPKVQAVQHLQNVYAIAEGENLLPPFSEWTLNADSKYVSPYEFLMTPSGVFKQNTVKLNSIPNTVYTFSINNLVSGQYIYFEEFDVNGVSLYGANQAAFTTISRTGNIVQTFTSKPTSSYFIIHFLNDDKPLAPGATFTFKEPMLTLGSTAKPFTPRNPSYLFSTVKLGQIGTVKDVLYKSDGQWYIRKAIEKDVVLDGSLTWSVGLDGAGFKYFNTSTPNAVDNIGLVTKYDGKRIPVVFGPWGPDMHQVFGNVCRVAMPDSDTGFGESYSPVPQEIQAWFYGWQAKTVDVNGKPTAWRSVGDGTDAPTQTLAYVSVNKAPNYTPYKLSYQLTTPVVLTANVEGDIALNGPTQIEVGSGIIVREKVTPYLSGGYYFINGNNLSAKLANRLGKVIAVYKNGIIDSKWSISTRSSVDATYGSQYASIAQADYDSTAEYKITYIVYDKHLLTNSTLEFKTTYDTTLKSVVDHLVEKQSDLVTISSVNVQAIAELYKRVKALGG